MGTQIIWIACGVAVLAAAIIYLFFLSRTRKVNLNQPPEPGQKPEWMRTTPPPETVAATRADGEGITLYDYDPGERLAAPFAEQIEDIIHARIKADPALAGTDVDLGTAPDGGLEIWVDGQLYTEIALIPNERLRQTIQGAVEKWNQSEES